MEDEAKTTSMRGLAIMEDENPEGKSSSVFSLFLTSQRDGIIRDGMRGQLDPPSSLNVTASCMNTLVALPLTHHCSSLGRGKSGAQARIALPAEGGSKPSTECPGLVSITRT